jgi:hypothetical protein
MGYQVLESSQMRTHVLAPGGIQNWGIFQVAARLADILIG